jgi:hypothetical protein
LERRGEEFRSIIADKFADKTLIVGEGYQWLMIRLTLSATDRERLSKLIADERRCCPILEWTLTDEMDGSTSLTVHGYEEDVRFVARLLDIERFK